VYTVVRRTAAQYVGNGPTHFSSLRQQETVANLGIRWSLARLKFTRYSSHMSR